MPETVAGVAALERRLTDVVVAELKGERALVCFSGGVDSTVVLAACVRAGIDTTALLAVSDSLADRDRRDANRIAAEIGAPIVELETAEIGDGAYRANTGDRCYHCKRTLYRTALEFVDASGLRGRLLNGTQLDDLGEVRPGLAAAKERRVFAPLVVAGLRKPQVRALAGHWMLSNFAKPATPCLASRIPVGTEVTAERLGQVGEVEEFLRARGVWPARARWRGQEVDVELPPDLATGARDASFRMDLERACSHAGFDRVTISERTGLRR